jgi:hypothetical protein
MALDPVIQDLVDFLADNSPFFTDHKDLIKHFGQKLSAVHRKYIKLGPSMAKRETTDVWGTCCLGDACWSDSNSECAAVGGNFSQP